MYVKEVSYDRETRDFAAFLDGNLVCYRATYMEAEEVLDGIVYERLRRKNPPVASETFASDPETRQAVSEATCESVADAFTTIAVANILDELCAAVDTARITTANSAPWLRAIDKAWGWLLAQDCIEYRESDHTLRVASATVAGRFYVANGACGCLGYTTGTSGVCWHRAAARLVRRAIELRDKA